jgi:polar amino acid transport system substrate-binding protein
MTSGSDRDLGRADGHVIERRAPLRARRCAVVTTPRIVSVFAALAVIVSVAAGCSPRRPATPSAPVLRVGITPTSPPFVFLQGDQLLGLEIDFALALGRELGRKVEFVEVQWTDQIPALVEGRSDVIMSGMSITAPRAVKIAFSAPYLRSHLLPMVRREDLGRYKRAASVVACQRPVGVIEGTTGERLVRERCPAGMISPYGDVEAAVNEIRSYRVDAVIHDGPILGWYVASDEANLALVLDSLAADDLGWGMRRTDEALRSAVNAALGRWRADGTRERILDRWLPYWRRLEDAAPPQ